jgi:hypothetical protein
MATRSVTHTNDEQIRCRLCHYWDETTRMRDLTEEQEDKLQCWAPLWCDQCTFIQAKILNACPHCWKLLSL